MPAIWSRALDAGPTPLRHVDFILNSAAVAGLLGGEEALTSMAAVHVFGGKTWLGWYNSPGSYTMGLRFMQLARSAVPAYDDGEVQADLATLFEYNGWKGPKFIAVHSGTIMQDTGHIAALLMKECAELGAAAVAGGRKTQSFGVTIARLPDPPEPNVKVQSPRPYVVFFASIPILVSVSTCALSAAYRDWYGFAIIFFGIIANGFASMVIGFGKFQFTHPEPAPGSPPGDGILGCDEGIVLLKGAEGAVNAVTRGRFFLLFESKDASRNLRICSILLITQSLVMLILISQSSFFGQLMFVISLATSWGYNLWLWTFDKEKIQREILRKVLGEPVLTKFVLKTRTSMLVFVALALNLTDVKEITKVFLVPDTSVWDKWKEIVIERLENQRNLEFKDADWKCDGFSEGQKSLLKTLLEDATVAYELFEEQKGKIAVDKGVVGNEETVASEKEAAG
ncbi:hypothetical protein BKA82DRAFT_4111724 [Pisolithus tinctorius]|nr:hypothetical protein BKA82DRAFT_4111724 [Pisolithus tinctorius]